MIESSTATRIPEDVTRDPQIEPQLPGAVGGPAGGARRDRVEVEERWAWAVSGFLVLPVALAGVWI